MWGLSHPFQLRPRGIRRPGPLPGPPGQDWIRTPRCPPWRPCIAQCCLKAPFERCPRAASWHPLCLQARGASHERCPALLQGMRGLNAAPPEDAPPTHRPRSVLHPAPSSHLPGQPRASPAAPPPPPQSASRTFLRHGDSRGWWEWGWSAQVRVPPADGMRKHGDPAATSSAVWERPPPQRPRRHEPPHADAPDRSLVSAMSLLLLSAC